MNDYKLVFTGTMGAGKTTAIAAISDVLAVNTDVENTDASLDKPLTTVGLDYGLLNLDSGDRVRLFGTPGQARFDFMWKILVKDAFGLIVLVDNSRPAPLDDLNDYLHGFASTLSEIPCVIGVGRMESHPMPTMDHYAEHLAKHDLALPILRVDVRKRDEVIGLVELILAQGEAIDVYV